MAARITSAKSPGRGPVAQRLLDWYDRHRRVLPWRAAPGEPADPYRVWLSEIMLQQTTVVTVAPYFERFLTRWPRVENLAAAPLDDVLRAWAGLGYYARARNLHRCARVVAGELGGRFPDSESALARLPGIGAYTAAAVAAIAFDRPATVVDGNVERVVARLFALEDPLPGAKVELRRLAATLTPERRPGDYAQAMMDLGATVCVPRTPRCVACPLVEGCEARRLGSAAELPRRAPKAERPTRRGIAFWILDGDGRVLLRRRAERGLLGGMMEIPSTEWRPDPWSGDEARDQAPLPAAWTALPGRVRHTFTHFHLELEVWAALAPPEASPRRGRADARSFETGPIEAGRWVAFDGLAEEALPSVMRKVVRHALSAAVAIDGCGRSGAVLE